MDIYITIEEKYLQAVSELKWGDTPLALQLLNEIINTDQEFARAHYQLGKIWYYYIKDYQTAGYHFKLCATLEPSFPDVYYHYLHLLIFLNMERDVEKVKHIALNTQGVNTASIYNLLALFSEKNKDLYGALDNYLKASLDVISNDDKDEIEKSITRVRSKLKQGKKYLYHFS